MDGFDLFIDGSIRLCGQEQEDSPFPPSQKFKTERVDRRANVI